MPGDRRTGPAYRRKVRQPRLGRQNHPPIRRKMKLAGLRGRRSERLRSLAAGIRKPSQVAQRVGLEVRIMTKTLQSQALLVAAGQNESAPKPGRSPTSTGQTSGSDLGRLDLQELTGARDRNRPGLHRLWDLAHEVDVQKPVLQARALDLNMVGELEATFEVPRGDALVE